MVSVREDLTGRKFGRLTVLKQAEDYISPKGYHQARWVCSCECGNENVVVPGRNLTKEKGTRSCGCIQREQLKSLHKANSKKNKYDIESFDYGIGWANNTDEEFYFDLEDYDKIKDYCWSVHTNKHGYKYLYSREKGTNKIIKMHVLLGFAYHDHEDRNPLNNRRSNIREATISQQDMNRNKQKNNTSGFIGVSWHKQKEGWEVSININKEHVYLGNFTNKEEAIKTRLCAEKEYYGEFAPQRHLFEEYGI